MVPRILSIAGSDSSGGAGIQADAKAITLLGGHAMTAITAVTAQNTLGVTRIDTLPAASVAAQIAACIEDIGVDAVKTGMFATADQVDAAGDVLVNADVPIVVDPVMIATSGAALAGNDVVDALRRRLFPRAALVTPNLDELGVLTETSITSLDDMIARAAAFAADRQVPVLAKGGHLAAGDMITDALCLPGADPRLYRHARVPTSETHGTGCTLASAIATALGAGAPLTAAVESARDYVRTALMTAPGLGARSGPLGPGRPLSPG